MGTAKKPPKNINLKNRTFYFIFDIEEFYLFFWADLYFYFIF